MTAPLAGRVAVVTGSSRGIGQASAAVLAARGAAVVMVARGADDLQTAVDAIRATGGRAVGVTADVGDDDAAESVLREARHFGGLDIVVNNAGIILQAKVADTTDEQWDQLVRTNLTAPFRLLRAAETMLVASSQARVINVASAFAVSGVARWSAYSATKGGLVALSRALAVEWARHQICVNVVAPGPTDTDLTKDVLGDPRTRDAAERRIPLGRIGRPEDMTGLVAYLASEDAGWITGQVIAVDGGWTAS